MLYVEHSAIQQLLREGYSYICVPIVKFSLFIEQRELNEIAQLSN